MADEPAPQTDETAPSLTALDERVGRIEAAVTTLVDKLHGGSQQVVEARLDEDSSVAAEVQRELARRDEATKKAEEADRLGKAEEAIAGLTEKTPLPPVRKIEHIMGWHG